MVNESVILKQVISWLKLKRNREIKVSSMARLYDLYRKDIVPKLKKTFNYSSVMQVPRIEKITINMGVGEAALDKKILMNAISDLEKIAGQKPISTLARKSIAGFKIREGWPIGCKVTLRRNRMYEF